MYQQKNNSADQCLSEDFEEDLTRGCLSWKFNDDLIHSTAVEDFEMICGNKSRKSLTQTMYMVGMLIGKRYFQKSSIIFFQFVCKAVFCLDG